MRTKPDQDEEQFQVKRYKIQHPISAYTFPHEARIHQVRFDDKYMHIELTDERVLSVPLRWIPTVHQASPEEREKYEINHDRTMIIWDPDKCAINDELRIADYLEINSDTSNSTKHRKIERRQTRTPRQYHARTLTTKGRN